MNGVEDRIIDEAATWHAASTHDDMDWDGFTAWLEADPRHRAAYDEVALADAVLGEHRDAFQPVAHAANDDPFGTEARPSRRIPVWARWAGAAVAASLVAILAIPQFIAPAPAVYETAATSRTIALDDGSSVLLAPHSRLEVGGDRQERMALNGGAWFDIRHDSSRPLAIRAGGVEISDIGTQFDVQAAGNQVRVEVAQGEVKVSSETLSQPIRLTQGRGLSFDSDAGTALVSSLQSDAIGEWRSGRLSYDSTPLALVADDLSRYAGVNVRVADELRNRQFSGTLVIGNGEAALRDLSRLMGVDLVTGPHGYRLDERNR